MDDYGQHGCFCAAGAACQRCTAVPSLATPTHKCPAPRRTRVHTYSGSTPSVCIAKSKNPGNSRRPLAGKLSAYRVPASSIPVTSPCPDPSAASWGPVDGEVAPASDPASASPLDFGDSRIVANAVSANPHLPGAPSTRLGHPCPATLSQATRSDVPVPANPPTAITGSGRPVRPICSIRGTWVC